jgi:hypothetical protein
MLKMPKHFLCRYLLFLLLLPVTTAVFGQQQQQQEEGWLVYENPLIGVTLNYPNNWLKQEILAGAVFSPSAEDPFDTSFSIGTEIDDSPAGLTPKEKVSQELQDRDMDLNVIEAGPTTLGGLEAAKVVFTLFPRIISDDPEDHRNITIALIIAKKDNTFYTVTFDADTGDEWDRLLPTYNKIVESIKIEQ